MSPAKSSPSREEAVTPPALVDVADILLRAAAEASRQHDRVGRLLAKGCLDDELTHVAELCDATVRHLAGTAATYESAAAHGKETVDEQVWRAANSLWHASRDAVRRHGDSESLAKRLGRHTPEQLAQVQVEFELQASSLLAMRQAIATYKKLRPEAE
jgi:hypothetical protein